MIAGIDIGSRSIELVVMSEDRIVHQDKAATTFDPLSQIRKLLNGLTLDSITATGYGRNLLNNKEMDVEVQSITEIRAYATGAHRLFPEARTILDIGGQDTKAISLEPSGKVRKFEMNDRCAAGTGKFLEHLANVFQIPVEAFGDYAMEGEKILTINSMCTVFAETEATSLMAQGNRPQDIALGLHASIIRRTVNMLHRVGLEFPLVFAGGVARNPCAVHLLREILGKAAVVPDEPDMVGAYGAALYGSERQTLM